MAVPEHTLILILNTVAVLHVAHGSPWGLLLVVQAWI